MKWNTLNALNVKKAQCDTAIVPVDMYVLNVNMEIFK